MVEKGECFASAAAADPNFCPRFDESSTGLISGITGVRPALASVYLIPMEGSIFC